MPVRQVRVTAAKSRRIVDEYSAVFDLPWDQSARDDVQVNVHIRTEELSCKLVINAYCTGNIITTPMSISLPDGSPILQWDGVFVILREQTGSADHAHYTPQTGQFVNISEILNNRRSQNPQGVGSTTTLRTVGMDMSGLSPDFTTLELRLIRVDNSPNITHSGLAGNTLLFNSLQNPRPFVDTRFFVFSHRDRRSRRVDHPQALYAKSSFLTESKSDYLSALLSDNGFQESQLTPLDGPFPNEAHIYTNDYDYLSDSDLDDDDDDYTWLDTNASSSHPQSQSDVEGTGSQLVKVAPPVPKANRKRSTAVAQKRAATPSPSSSPVRKPPPAHSTTHASDLTGKTILIKDGAYATWQALVYYIYTGEIAFAPLMQRDKKARAKFIAEYREKNPIKPVPCSAKSMYRLADKTGLKELQALSLKHLSQQLSEETILQEVFCQFTSRYPEILAIELAFLNNNFKNLKKSDTFKTMVETLMLEDPVRAVPIILPLLTEAEDK